MIYGRELHPTSLLRPAFRVTVVHHSADAAGTAQLLFSSGFGGHEDA